jgi:ribonuclease P protein component
MVFSYAAAPPKGARFCAQDGRKAGSVWPCRSVPGELGTVKRAAVGRRYGLGAERRLANKADFERLLREGSRRSRSGYTFFTSTRAAGPPRLGIVISRKHAAKATVRNRIKRCIREAFRLEQAGLGAVDVLVRPPFGARPGAQMLGRLRELFLELSK